MNSKQITDLVWALVFLFTWPFIVAWFVVVEPVRFVVRLIRDYHQDQRTTPEALEKQARERTQFLYNEVAAITATIPSREDFADPIAAEIIDDPDDDTYDPMIDCALECYDLEGWGKQVPEPPAICNSIEAARYRDWLSAYAAKQKPRAVQVAQEILTEVFLSLKPSIPPTTGKDIVVRFADLTPNLGKLVEAAAMRFYRDDAIELGVFNALRSQLNRNLHQVTGLPYTPQHFDSPKLLMPSQYHGENVAYAYLHHTPLLQLFDIKVGLAIPEEARFEGQWIVGPQGTGKTQFLQNQILMLLPKVLRGQASVIVMDSHEELIGTLCRLKVMQKHIVLIDANDVEYPLALNLFDLGAADNLTPVEKERRLNTALEVVGFILDSLLGSDLTAKQQVVFRFLTQAMLAIPSATILTFQDLLQNGTGKYQAYIDTLEGAAKTFFATQFNDSEFRKTRSEINRRLYGILGIHAWERMFTQPKTKLDLFAEMNAGKLILINTAKSLLQPKGCEAFGRFFLALITMAAQRRATVSHKLPCHVFIDEIADYASDANINVIIEQCRKQKIALTVAHQNCSQLSQRVKATLQTVAIKCAASLAPEDAATLAPGMKVKPQELQEQKKGTFMVYVRNVTPKALPVTVRFGALEGLDQVDETKFAALRDTLREKYAAKKQEPATQQPPHEEAADAVHAQSNDARTWAKPVDTNLPKKTENDKKRPKKTNGKHFVTDVDIFGN